MGPLAANSHRFLFTDRTIWRFCSLAEQAFVAISSATLPALRAV